VGGCCLGGCRLTIVHQLSYSAVGYASSAASHGGALVTDDAGADGQVLIFSFFPVPKEVADALSSQPPGSTSFLSLSDTQSRLL
jgi:hypothetical protein